MNMHTDAPGINEAPRRTSPPPSTMARLLFAVAVVGMLGAPAFAQSQSRERARITPPKNTSNQGGRNPSNQQVGEAIIGGLILGAAINEAMQPPRRPNYPPSRPQNYYPSQPQYVPSRPQYIESQPQYIESQPAERIISSRPVETVVSETPVTPKPNVVKETPKPNTSLKSLAGSLALADGLAADPLLAVSTQQSVEQLNDQIDAWVASNGTPEMKADWQAVVASGSSAASIEHWWNKYGGAISDPNIASLGPIHVGMSKLVQDLRDGLLSNAGKKAAIDKLADMVSNLPAAHPLRAELAKDLARMRQFQKLGELLSLASVAPDPIVPILQGTQAMGMPIPVVAEVLDIPLMQHPVDDAESLPSNVVIRVVNPSTNAQSVNCTIGSRQVEMAPGSAEKLTSSTSVVFDPGDGTRRSVSVTNGTWAWKIENGLWSLPKVTPRITLDNSKFKGVFHYTVNGKHASLAAGETAEHSHPMAIEIAFDRGNGDGIATKLLTFGTYAVGIDVASRGLELFRTDIPSMPPTTAVEAAVATEAAAPDPKSSVAGDRVRKALENVEKQKELARLLESLEKGKP